MASPAVAAALAAHPDLPDRYRCGESLNDLAGSTGLSFSMVRRVLLAAGVTLRRRGAQYRYTGDAGRLERIRQRAARVRQGHEALAVQLRAAGWRCEPPEQEVEAEWWTASDVAAYLGVGLSTVTWYRQRGQLPEPGQMKGRRYEWRPAAIRAWRAPPQDPAGGAVAE